MDRRQLAHRYVPQLRNDVFLYNPSVSGRRPRGNAATNVALKPVPKIFCDSHLRRFDVATFVTLCQQPGEFSLRLAFRSPERSVLGNPLSRHRIATQVELDLPRAFALSPDMA